MLVLYVCYHRFFIVLVSVFETGFLHIALVLLELTL